MKFGYKVLIILCVFIGALAFFSGTIKESFFSGDARTTEMAEATLPTITIEVDGNEINRLHGYISNLDEKIMRESVTPLTSEREFTVLIDENESVVKKLKYEVFNVNGNELESDTFTVLDVADGPKKVKIPLREMMKSGQEYAAKITLITNKSKRIYYYTRLKMYDDGHLYEKLDFVKSFHTILLSGTDEEKQSLTKYLESSRAEDNSSFASINIKSSYEMVTWGDLAPELLYEEVPTVTEFYDSMASVRLSSFVCVETDYGVEYYTVKEDFRITYTPSRVYLYTYNRSMEAVYDIENTSISKNEFKLGITADTDAETGICDSGRFIAFEYGRELMLYDSETNSMFRVFSFRQGNIDVARDYYDNHEVRLLRVYDSGNVDFVVCGYMNRGEYEGRVGIVLYRYVYEDNRIEEQLYIPISSSYQQLKTDMTGFSYLNAKQMFYFAIYDSIYAYNIVTGELGILAQNVPTHSMVYCEDEKYLAWQNKEDSNNADKITLFSLEDGEAGYIEAGPGESIRLYGRINNNIVYGYALRDDVCILYDGTRTLPSYRLVIANGSGEVLKTYEEPGLYISSVDFGENYLILSRVTKKAGERITYEPADADTIMNRYVPIDRPVEIVKRITDRMLTEYYVSLPENVNIPSTPPLEIAKNTVLNYDTTTRVGEPEDRTRLYYVYSFGEISYASASAALAVKAADTFTGTVIDSAGTIVWERGIKAGRSEIKGYAEIISDSSLGSVGAALKIMLLRKNSDADTSTFNSLETTVSDWLARNTKVSCVDLTGATLDEVLYYVYKGRPVAAIRSDGSGCVLVAYDANSVTVFDPKKGKTVKYPLKEAVSMFETSGNMFFSYIN